MSLRRYTATALSTTSAVLAIATDAQTALALSPLVVLAAGYALCAGVLTGFACRIVRDPGLLDTWHATRSEAEAQRDHDELKRRLLGGAR